MPAQDAWRPEEDTQLRQLYAKYGTRWVGVVWGGEGGCCVVLRLGRVGATACNAGGRESWLCLLPSCYRKPLLEHPKPT